MNKLIFLTIILAHAAFTIKEMAAHEKTSRNELDKLKEQLIPLEFLQTGGNYSSVDAKKILIEKCKKTSGANATAVVNKIEKAFTIFVECMSVLGNLTEIQLEIDMARPLGELDDVFEKYCNKRLQAEKCIRNFNEKIQPCLSEEEKKHNVISVRIITRLFEFACTKGGDNLALFIAEEGPECLEESKDYITECMNSSFSGYVPKMGLIPEMIQLPKLVMGPKQCSDLLDFEKCVVTHMEECDDVTPANIIQSIFKFIKNETDCLTKPVDRKHRNRKNNSEVAYIISYLIAITFLINVALL